MKDLWAIFLVIGLMIGALILLSYRYAHEDVRCVLIHGHIYRPAGSRVTLCLTSDNRVITNW